MVTRVTEAANPGATSWVTSDDRVRIYDTVQGIDIQVTLGQLATFVNAALGLPTIAPGDGGKVLTVNVAEDGYELTAPA